MKRKLLAFAAVVACSISLPAFAQKGYVGASYLSGSAEFSSGIQTFDASSDAWKIYGGTELNKFFALELTYYDLGDFDDAQGGTTFHASIDAWDLAFRGIIPLGKHFELFGRLGYSYMSVESSTTIGLSSVSVDGSNWELLYGAGVGVKLGERFGLRAEWEAWDVADSLDAWSVGAYFRF